MKRRAFSLILAALLFLLLPGVAAAGTPQFTDIQSHWAKDYIVNFAAKGYIEGYPDKTFRPDKPVSRAEFTCMLLNSMEIVPGSTSVQSFSDTSKHWAHAQIAEAVRRGILIVSEYPKGFKPDDPILRSEAAAMMVRALGKKPDLTATTFKDNAQVAKSMYHGYIKTASAEGLMHGYTDGTFQPFRGVTRGEACAMLSSLLNKTGTSSTPAVSTSAPTGSTNSSGNTGLVLRGTRYDPASTPIFIKRNDTNVRISSIGLAGSFVSVNNTFPYPLNSAISNPDLVIGNAYYENCRLSISGNDVLVTPADIKLDSLTYNSYKYGADFVKLYIGSKNSSNYLSDVELVDTHTVRVAGTSYDINNVQIAVALDTEFYAITRIGFDNGSVDLSLTAISPVVMSDLNLSNVSAIFVDNQPLTMSGISTLLFIIDGSGYDLSRVTIDASGNFSANDKTYTPDQVTMVINDSFYKLLNVQITNKKFCFYTTQSSVSSWVQINNKYRDASGVQILYGSNTYTLDQALVVKRNVIRIGNRQYTVKNNGFLCRIDSTLYAIDDIDYDTNLQIVTMDVTASTATWTGTVSSQPEKYVFYLNNSVYQDGATSKVTIYAGGDWQTFDNITFSDQTHFVYDGSTYSLVGTKVQISGDQFVITDSAWHVSSGVLDLYLETT